jgi:hypothetical protein
MSPFSYRATLRSYVKFGVRAFTQPAGQHLDPAFHATDYLLAAAADRFAHSDDFHWGLLHHL